MSRYILIYETVGIMSKVIENMIRHLDSVQFKKYNYMLPPLELPFPWLENGDQAVSKRQPMGRSLVHALIYGEAVPKRQPMRAGGCFQQYVLLVNVCILFR